MINYHLKPWEIHEIWHVDVYANSDFVTTLGEMASEKEAVKVGQAFIDGIKFARGES
jgi:hypothetical protein